MRTKKQIEYYNELGKDILNRLIKGVHDNGCPPGDSLIILKGMIMSILYSLGHGSTKTMDKDDLLTFVAGLVHDIKSQVYDRLYGEDDEDDEDDDEEEEEEEDFLQ